jgi:hypothetical protein
MATTVSYTFVTESNFGLGEPSTAAAIGANYDGDILLLSATADGLEGSLSYGSGGLGLNFGGSDPSITALTSGNFVIAADLGRQISYRIYNPFELKLLHEATIPSTGEVNEIDTAALAGGGFVIAFEKTYTDTDVDVRFSLRNADGSLIKEIAVDGSTANDSKATVVALADGGFAVGWQRLDGTETQMWYAVYNADGSVRKAPAACDTFGSINRDAQMVALKDGGFAVLYEDNGWTSGGATELTYVRFDPDGTQDGYIKISDTIAQGDELLAATVLKDGTVLIVSGDGGANGLLTLFDPVSGQILQRGDFDGADGISDGLELTALPDGGFMMMTAGGNPIVHRLFARRDHVGDGADDAMAGNGGREYFAGGGGADTISGGGGDDVIDGGAGPDKMYGQGGSDTFELAAGTAEAGEIIEGGAGHDRLRIEAQDLRLVQIGSIEELVLIVNPAVTAVTTIGAGQIGTGFSKTLNIRGNYDVDETVRIVMGSVDQLNLSGFGRESFGNPVGGHGKGGGEGDSADRLLVIGDASAETVTGSSGRDDINAGGGADTLIGGGGVDRLKGGLGNDVYQVNAMGEAIELAGQGIDLVRSEIDYRLSDHIEKLRLTGSAGINGIGNALGNAITGNAGNNLLNGKGGKDVLTGGAGADAFLFNSELDPLGNVDKIVDFEVGIDKIRLDDAIFTGLTNAGKAGAFHVGTAAADANDRIIYNPETGALLFDADGAGGEAAVRFATLDPGLQLSAADLIIV